MYIYIYIYIYIYMYVCMIAIGFSAQFFRIFVIGFVT